MELTQSQIQLDKLYDLLEKTRTAMLGSDYQTRMQLKEIQEKVICKIKSLRHDMSTQL